VFFYPFTRMASGTAYLVQYWILIASNLMSIGLIAYCLFRSSAQSAGAGLPAFPVVATGILVTVVALSEQFHGYGLEFALERGNQFRLGPPPALAGAQYTAAFNEVKSLGMLGGTTATADQMLIGKFWGGAIQNYWNEITQTAVQAHHLTTAQSARVFALLNITLADEVIAFYDTKYTYAFWRPVTAIRAADTDGNPDTLVDPNWLPQATKTAADPSYPGAHATISAGAEFVLNAVFGTKPFNLVVTSEVLPGTTRSFDSFAGAENEASASRIFAGQHFRTDENAGEKLGTSVADFVVDNFLTRVHDREDRDHEGRDN